MFSVIIKGSRISRHLISLQMDVILAIAADEIYGFKQGKNEIPKFVI